MKPEHCTALRFIPEWSGNRTLPRSDGSFRLAGKPFDRLVPTSQDPFGIDECIGDLAPTDAGICVSNRVLNFNCPISPFYGQGDWHGDFTWADVRRTQTTRVR